MSKHNKFQDEDKNAVQLLQEIHAGITNPKTLDKRSRQECVELLITEGYTHAQISQVLDCSQKTVSRDMKEIRRRNQLVPDIDFAKQFVGEMFRRGMNHHSSLVRIARSKNISSGEKIQAEYIAWKIFKELSEKLQSLGYLPLRSTEIVGDIFHHRDEEVTPDQMRKMIATIEESGKEAGILNKEMKSKIKELKARIKQSEIALEIKRLKENTDDNKEDKNE